jgi:hypothetical protein
MGLSMYPPIVARQWLSKYVPAAMSCWRCHFLYGLCVVSEESSSSYQNFLFLSLSSIDISIRVGHLIVKSPLFFML